MEEGEETESGFVKVFSLRKSGISRFDTKGRFDIFYGGNIGTSCVLADESLVDGKLQRKYANLLEANSLKQAMAGQRERRDISMRKMARSVECP